MAGRGPAPKDPNLRARTNTPSRGDWIDLPAAPYRGSRAHLPKVQGGLLESTKKAWAAWWSNPAAHMWTEADWPTLQTAVALLDTTTRMQAAGVTKSLTSLIKEYRLILDGLGLTENGRRNFRWRLPTGESPKDQPHLATVTSITEKVPSRQRPDPRKT